MILYSSGGGRKET